jgi:hypothetical protein
VPEVSNAGDDVWVLVHLYKDACVPCPHPPSPSSYHLRSHCFPHDPVCPQRFDTCRPEIQRHATTSGGPLMISPSRTISPELSESSKSSLSLRRCPECACSLVVAGTRSVSCWTSA